MPVSVVVGGQFGSEGKGKVAHYFAKRSSAAVAVRVGGTNSGHTVIGEDGTPRVFRMLPTASILPDVMCVLPAGSYIDPGILRDECERANLDPSRLAIDPNAVVISDEDRREEAESGLKASIGSTGSGTGAAVRRRIARLSEEHLAKNCDDLRRFLTPAVPLLRNHLHGGDRVIIEGTQGHGLSLLHAADYPVATSRDTTAAGFVSEAGLSPLDVDEVVLVIRAFPIRVGGNSGPLPSEIDWDVVTAESGRTEPVREYTSVTRKLRRVARFDPDVVRAAIATNRPTHIVMNHLDYLGTSSEHDEIEREFIRSVEKDLGARIDLLGHGPADLVQSSTRD